MYACMSVCVCVCVLMKLLLTTKYFRSIEPDAVVVVEQNDSDVFDNSGKSSDWASRSDGLTAGPWRATSVISDGSSNPDKTNKMNHNGIDASAGPSAVSRNAPADASAFNRSFGPSISIKKLTSQKTG